MDIEGMCVPDWLGVSLEDVDGVDGRVSEVPQPEGGVPGWGDHEALVGVGAAVGQLLVMTFTHRLVANAVN